MVERIRQLIEARQLTPTQFADSIGVARPIISHILSGRNKPSLEVVQKIIGAFPDLSLPWLLNGIGEMLTSPALAIPSTQATDVKPQVSRRSAESASGGTIVAHQEHQDTRLARRAAKELQRPLFEKSGQLKDLVIAPTPKTSEKSDQQSALPADASTSVSAVPTSDTLKVPPPVAELGSAEKQAARDKAPATVPTPATPVAAVFAKPDKAIRRIVIFYQDGTFTDYKPEDI